MCHLLARRVERLDREVAPFSLCLDLFLFGDDQAFDLGVGGRGYDLLV